MKKKISVILISLLMATLCVCLIACNETDGERDYAFTDLYTAYEITKVDIAQKSTFNCDYLVACDIAPSDSAKVYVTRYEKISETDSAIDYTQKDGKYAFNATVTSASYYIHIVDGDKTAILPMTRPQMAPTLTDNGDNCVVKYNFVNGTSWSSFCDPTGKSVYKSASPSFDEQSASLVAKNVAIWQADTTTDYSPSTETPYYFIVLSAKNGIVHFVSSPLFSVEKAYSDLQVSLQDVDGTASLVVEGNFVIGGDVAVELYSADEKLGKVLEKLGERVTGNAGDTFKATIDVSQVLNGETGAGIWYDVKLSSSIGGLYDVSVNCADMMQEIMSGNSKFEFQNYGGLLKLNYVYNAKFGLNSVTIDATGVPTLVVKGSVSSNVHDIKLHANFVDNGSAPCDDKYWNNQSAESGKFEFRIALSDLYSLTGSTPWAWFHLYVYTDASNPESADLNRGSVLTVDDYYDYNGVRYTIKAWTGNGEVGKGLAIQTQVL